MSVAVAAVAGSRTTTKAESLTSSNIARWAARAPSALAAPGASSFGRKASST
jgi:hypothetical protein